MSSQKIIQNMDRWVSSFSEDTSNSICAMYDEQASLWGTLSPIRRSNPALIKDYFDQIFKHQNRRVTIDDSTIRFYGDIAISNGLYTFEWLNEGINVTTVARFSFVYMKRDGHWLIVEHHSSAIPVTA